MALDPDTFDALMDTIRRFVAERLRPLEAAVEVEAAVPRLELEPEEAGRRPS